MILPVPLQERLLASHRVGEHGVHVPVLFHAHEAQRPIHDPARQEGHTATQGHRGDGDDDFVEQTRVVELSHQIAATAEPHVATARGFHHFRVHSGDISLNEAQVRSGDRR